MKHLLPCVFCCLSCTAAVIAQQKRVDASAATGTVSGHVYCTDTNAPARMATVVLQPAGAIDAITPGEDKRIDSRGEAVQTLMDGSFNIQHVEPGTYYVIASLAGYVSPLAPLYLETGDNP